MAWRPSDWVLEGELDNTQPGWTIGRVRIQGREEPLKLKLAGNCHPDLAGWKFRIVRIDPFRTGLKIFNLMESPPINREQSATSRPIR